jgi:diguanylate cyclase (GGDEF)-like protein/PAS domain S-box-containing protein
MTAPGARIALLALTYFTVTSLTIGLTRFGGGLALVWLGSAIAAAMLIHLERTDWLRGMMAIGGASALATSLFGFGPKMAVPLALINVFEAWLVASLLMMLRPKRDWLDSAGGLAALVIGGGLAAPGIAAIAGGFVASLVVPGSWSFHAGNWWAAHGLGTLIGFPIFFLLLGRLLARPAARWKPGLTAELVGHLLLIAVVTAAAMGQAVLPLLFLPVAPLLVAAFRCGREGATLGLLVIATAAVLLHGEGTLIGSVPITTAQKALFMQLYLATLSLLAIPLSVALRQHHLLIVELEERKALKQLIAEHSDDALLNLDEHGRIRYASVAAERLSGSEELQGEPLAVFFDPLDELLVRGALAQAAAAPGQTVDMERAVVRADQQLWLEAKIRAVALEGNARGLHGYAVTIRDVTARKQTELDAIQAAETDPLTGLANRRALLGQLERALAHAEQRPFAVAILDLDHFKAINDTHGHHAGDQVLREVAAVMRRMSSPSRFFARLGGEEFALVSRQASFEGALAVCEQLREAIAELRFAGSAGHEFGVTASIGCTRIDRGGTAAQALQAADALLYHAKQAGRNRVEAMPWKGERRVIRRAA